MKTAREMVHESVFFQERCSHPDESVAEDDHVGACNKITAAIEARDVEHGRVLALATERLTAAQEQLYAKREGLQAANEALGVARRERDEARSLLSRAREALEVATKALGEMGEEPCAFDGGYANCWEAIKADDIDAGEGIPCSRCVSLRALEAIAASPPPGRVAREEETR